MNEKTVRGRNPGKLRPVTPAVSEDKLPSALYIEAGLKNLPPGSISEAAIWKSCNRREGSLKTAWYHHQVVLGHWCRFLADGTVWFIPDVRWALDEVRAGRLRQRRIWGRMFFVPTKKPGVGT